MSNLDTSVIFIYMLLVLAAGMVFARVSKDTKSFFGAGGQAPWWISGLSMYMSFFSAGTFVVWGTIAYEQGWVAITMQWTMCLAALIVALVIAPRWHQTGCSTVAEFIGMRFGTGLQQLYSYITLLLGMIGSGVVLYPVARIVQVASGMQLSTATILLGGAVVCYTATGGLWAVLITDTLQFVILTVSVLSLVPLALNKIGGPEALINNAPEGFFNLFSEEFTPTFIIAFIFYHIFVLGGNWGFVQRYTCVENKRDARKVGLLFAVLYLLSPVFWMIPPMAFRILNPELSGLGSEGAYILISKAVMPMGFLGLMVAAMISATASTANTNMNISSAVFTFDIYKKLIRKKASDKEMMLVARISTLIFGIGMIVIALLVPKAGGIVNVVVTIGAMTGGPVLAPPIWGLFSKRIDKRAALSATLIGLTINLFLKFAAPLLFGYTMSRGAEMFIGVSGTVLVLLAFELTSPIQPVKRVKPAVIPENEPVCDAPTENTFAIRVLATMLLITGAAILVLGLINEGSHLLGIYSSLPVLILAALCWKISWRTAK